MEKYVIRGGVPLQGEVTVSGSKNATVAIIPATVLVKGTCIIENVPDINDVALLFNILTRMGAEVRSLDRTTVSIDCTQVRDCCVEDCEAVRKMRASYYFIGALLGRFGNAKVGLPGGCDFGVRPIDQHIKGFEALGAEISIEHGIVNASSDGLREASIYFDVVSVGATINVMLAAVGVPGKTVIENAAKEPHIVDVANFLNSMGADIKGAGTDVIRIRGGQELHGGRYEVIPDQIEAGTYMAAAAAVQGSDVLIKNVIPKHMESISAKLEEAGVTVVENDDSIQVRRDGPLNRINVKTLPYPGFPTDMQPQITTLLCLAEGTSIITEGVYDHRFRYAEELRRMGAKMDVDGKICVVEGISAFMGARVRACDLRAGVAMVIAGLAAEGITEVFDIEHIERGYENLVEKLQAIGGRISRVTEKKPVLEAGKIG